MQLMPIGKSTRTHVSKKLRLRQIKVIESQNHSQNSIYDYTHGNDTEWIGHPGLNKILNLEVIAIVFQMG